MLEKLPTEILVLIFNNLPEVCLVELLFTSRRIRDIVVENYFISKIIKSSSHDPLLSIRWENVEGYTEPIKKEAAIIEMCKSIALEGFRDPLVRITDKSLQGIPRMKPLEITVILDKLVILVDDSLLIYSANSFELLKTIRSYMSNIWKSGCSVMIPDNESLKMLNMDTLETSCQSLGGFFPVDFGFLRYGCNDKVSVYIGRDLDLRIWSFKDMRMMTIPNNYRNQEVHRLCLNNRFLVLSATFGMSSALLRLRFYHGMEFDTETEHLGGDYWCDSTLTDIKTDHQTVNDILLSSNNLLAITYLYKGICTIKIIDLISNTRISSFGQDHTTLSKRPITLQWLDERLYCLFTRSDGTKSIKYFDCVKKDLTDVDCVTNISWPNLLMIGYLDILQLYSNDANIMLKWYSLI